MLSTEPMLALVNSAGFVYYFVWSFFQLAVVRKLWLLREKKAANL